MYSSPSKNCYRESFTIFKQEDTKIKRGELKGSLAFFPCKSAKMKIDFTYLFNDLIKGLVTGLLDDDVVVAASV